MRWILRMALREAKFTRVRGLLMLFSMVFGLSVLVSFSSLKQGFREDFYSIAEIVVGGDLRVEIHGQPSERLRRLLPNTAEQREAYWITGGFLVDRTNQQQFPVEFWLSRDNVVISDAVAAPSELQSASVIPISGLIHESALENLANVGSVDFVLGNSDLRFQPELSVIPEDPIPIWNKQRTNGVVQHPMRVLIASPLERLLVEAEGIDWQQIWLYNWNSIEKAEDLSLPVEQALEYIEQEASGVELFAQTPTNTAFFQHFRTISNTLFLTAFSALILGALAYTVTFVDFFRGRVEHISLYRCFGSSLLSSWSIYGFQVLFYVIASVVLAGLFSISAQYGIPYLIERLTGVQTSQTINWQVMGISLAFGGVFILIPGITAVLPLFGCEPVEVLRSVKMPARVKEYHWIQRILVAVSTILAVTFCLDMIDDKSFGAAYISLLLGVFGILLLIAFGSRYGVRALTRIRRSYPLTQASANLFRRQNQYVFTLTSIAFGLFLITALYQFFSGYSKMGLGLDFIDLEASDSSLAVYFNWLEQVFFLNQLLGVTVLVIGVLTVFILLMVQRRTRVYECVVLGTLGATDQTLRSIMLWESLFAAVIAALSGTVVGLVFSAIVFGGMLGMPLGFPWLTVFNVIAGTILMMLLIGWINTRGIIGFPPLEILRKRRHFASW